MLLGGLDVYDRVGRLAESNQLAAHGEPKLVDHFAFRFTNGQRGQTVRPSLQNEVKPTGGAVSNVEFPHGKVLVLEQIESLHKSLNAVDKRCLGPVRFDGTLIVGSDGLFKYTSVDAIRTHCDADSADEIARSLIDLVKLPSGDFHDDTTVAVCRYLKG